MASALLKSGTVFAAQVVKSNRPLTAVSKMYFKTAALAHQQATAPAVETDVTTIKPASEIPGPPKLPLILAAIRLMLNKDFDRKRPHIYWMKLFDDYGPIYKIETSYIPPMIFMKDPDDCENLMRATMEEPVRTAFFSLAKVRKEDTDNYFENKAGLLPENGEEWKRVRSRVQTPMMKPKNVSSYLSRMDEVSLDFMDRISELQKLHGEMPSNFQTELYKWSLESVGLVALNRRMGCLEPNLADDSEPMTLIREANNMFAALNDTELSLPLWRLFPTKSYRKLRKSHGIFLRIADQNIRETESQLLAKKDGHEGQELTLMETLLLTPGLSRKDVVTLILDMLFAGIDTTAHTVGFTLYLLAKNPKSQAKLQEEVDKVLGDYKGPLTAKHLGQLSYLKAVIKESLRIFPLTMGVGRCLTNDLVVGGYLVPKGYTVAVLNKCISMDEKWFPRAKEFIPERWLRHKPLGPIHPFASLPFSNGTRMCIGRRIAEQEIYTFLARAMQRYTVNYKYQDMDVISRMIFVPSEPLRFSFTERS